MNCKKMTKLNINIVKKFVLNRNIIPIHLFTMNNELITTPKANFSSSKTSIL